MSSKPVVARKSAAAAVAAVAAVAEPASCSSAEAMTEVADFESLKAAAVQLVGTDLFKLEKVIMAEIERRCKGGEACAAPKKAGTGEVPAALRKPNAWARFVHAHALANGSPAFVYKQRRKVDGEFVVAEIECPATVEANGAWIIPNTVTAKKPQGEQITLSMAMSLASMYWGGPAKSKSGTNQALWDEFEAQYNAGLPTAAVAAAPKVVKRTKEEIHQEKLRKEAEHAALMAENKKKRDEATLKRREEKAAAKEIEKQLKAAAGKKAAVPAVKKATEVVAWTCPNDGMVHDFQWKGAMYYRNFNGQIWIQTDEEEMGDWAGVWNAAANDIDSTVADPYAE